MNNIQMSFSDIFSQFDPQVTSRKLQSYRSIDLSGINETQIKSLQVMLNANKVMADSGQAFFGIYAANLRDVTQELTNTVGSADNHQELLNSQIKYMSTALRMTVKSSVEASELVKRTQREITTMVSSRIVESLEEIKDSTSKFS